FLYDRATGATTLVSSAFNSSATTAHGTSKNPAISADGKWIAYVSNSDNLVATETTPSGVQTLHDQYWVFLYNVQTGVNTLVSHQASDQGAGYQTTLANGSSGIVPLVGINAAANTTSVSVSKDGRYVVYVSTATHLVNGQQAGASGVTLANA